jgi:prepilin-type N-terminal cleavage/methylation domain-containing protein
MTIITAAGRAKGQEHRARRLRAGFSLVEVMVAATLSAIILTGILTTFVFFGKSGMRMIRYTDMEANAREALGRFAQDARQAQDAAWLSSQSLRLTVDTVPVTYTYNSGAKTLTRTVGGATEVLVRSISGFQFTAYTVDMNAVNLQGNLATAASSTKMVQMDIDLASNSTAAGLATSQILSARYVLRNKKTS